MAGALWSAVRHLYAGLMSRHIIIVAHGSAGDVHPLLAIGQALKQRGQRVTVLTNGHFAPLIQRLDLELIETGSESDYQTAMRDPQLWHPRHGLRAVWRHGVSSMLDSWRWIRANAGSDAVVVGSTLALGARLAHDSDGLPLVTVHLAPATLMSCRQPPQVGALPWPSWLPPAVVSGVWSLVEWAETDRLMAPAINRARGEAGLPPVRHIMRHYLHSPQRVLLLWPDWFASDAGDWPANSQCLGFPRFDEGGLHPWPPALQAFLHDGPAPVLFTPGSAMVQAQTFFRSAVSACEALGLRAILATPWGEQLPSLPSTMLHCGYVPFSELLPHVAAFVHHGGIGTSSQGLAAGVPQLVVPNAFDQFDNGARLQQLGVGRLLPRHCGSKALQRGLQQVLQSEATRAACHHWQAQLPDPAAVLQAACSAILTMPAR